MATNTTNYNLVKPAYADTADIADINGNMDIIDGQMKTNADDVSATNTSLGKTEAGLAVIVTGDTCPVSVPAGGYAYIKSNTHGLSEGLYRNKTSSAFPTSGGTANSSVFEAVSKGGINALKDNIDTVETKAANLVNAKISTATGASGSYSNTGTGWEYTGISFTVPTYYRYIVYVETTWSSGMCTGLGIHEYQTITSPHVAPKFTHTNGNSEVYCTPAYVLLAGTYYVFSKRATASLSPNDYYIRVISIDTRTLV